MFFFFSCKVFQSQLVTWGEFIQDSQIFLPSNLTCIFLVKIVGAIPGSSICVSNLCPNSPRKTLPLKAGTFYIGRIISFRFLHSLTPLTPSLPPSLFRQLVGPLGRPRYPPWGVFMWRNLLAILATSRLGFASFFFFRSPMWRIPVGSTGWYIYLT